MSVKPVFLQYILGEHEATDVTSDLVVNARAIEVACLIICCKTVQRLIILLAGFSFNFDTLGPNSVRLCPFVSSLFVKPQRRLAGSLEVARVAPEGNCIKIGPPGKLILSK